MKGGAKTLANESRNIYIGKDALKDRQRGVKVKRQAR
jgi:hypothetical protein